MSLTKKNFMIRKLVGGVTLAAALVAYLPFTTMADDNVVRATDSFVGDGLVDGINSSVTGMDDVYDSIHTSTVDAEKVNASSDTNSGDGKNSKKSDKTLSIDKVEVKKDEASAENGIVTGDTADTLKQKMNDQKTGTLHELEHSAQRPERVLITQIFGIALGAIGVILMVIFLLSRSRNSGSGSGKH